MKAPLLMCLIMLASSPLFANDSKVSSSQNSNNQTKEHALNNEEEFSIVSEKDWFFPQYHTDKPKDKFISKTKTINLD